MIGPNHRETQCCNSFSSRHVPSSHIQARISTRDTSAFKETLPTSITTTGGLRRRSLAKCKAANNNDNNKGAASELANNIRKWVGIDPVKLNKLTGAVNDRLNQPPSSRGDQNNRNGTFSSNQEQSSTPTPPHPSPWADWSSEDQDWDMWSGIAAIDLDDEDEVAELREQVLERRKARAGQRSRVRDEYMRPIVDAQGIYNRLTFDELDSEERVFIEAITNQYESREAIYFGAALVGVPLVVGFIVSRLVAEPVWDFATSINPEAFALTDEQKVEGAQEVHKEELRLKLEAAVGQAPPLTDEVLLQHLRKQAKEIETTMRQDNRSALLNVVSDSSAGLTLFAMLLRPSSQRSILFRTIGRVFAGLSDTAKAFFIILITDTLLGYHSEEGWTAGLRILGHHYGVSPEMEGLNLFVATVPVLLDSLFKYWIFVELNKIDPAAAVTLRQMDRH